MKDNVVKTPFSEMKSLLYATLAGVSFAISNFILGNNSQLGALTRLVAANGSLVFATSYITFLFTKSLLKKSEFYNWKKSNFRKSQNGEFYWTNLLGAFLYTAINSAAGFALVYAFQFAKYGNMNQGILTSLFGLSSIFSAILAYYIFGDKLKFYHVS